MATPICESASLVPGSSGSLLRLALLALVALPCAARAAPGYVVPPHRLEQPPAGELETIAGVAGSKSKLIDGLARRDAHSKAHGCVRGSFRTLTTLPARYQSPVFTPGMTYPAWVRFSNGLAPAMRVRG
jgi:hypothetical protein